MMMEKPSQSPANRVVTITRKIQNATGFAKGYNFVLWFICIGALLGFTLARLEYLSFNGRFCNAAAHSGGGAAPGECFWYRSTRRNYIGIVMHLATILPASLLVCLQFTPFIRHRWILIHRICGYLAIILALLSQASVLMIANHAFGGDNSVRTAIGAMVVATTTALALAYYNIKRLQIDQHRVWMIRAWAWFASIITERIIMIIMIEIEAVWPAEALVYYTEPCLELLFLYANNTTRLLEMYPSCHGTAGSLVSNGSIAIASNFKSKDVANIAAAFDSNFGPSLWLAFALHVLAVELYLHLTPQESRRLRQLSHERQVERGMRRAADA